MRRGRPTVHKAFDEATAILAGDSLLAIAFECLTRADVPVELTRKELAVLEALMTADGAAVSAEELLERVWDEAADPFTTAVKKTMHRLRAKLGDPPVIDTVREGGYRIGAS